MLIHDAVEYFGSKAALAEALHLTHAAVYAWRKELVPPLRAAQIEQLTAGKLKFDPNQYRTWNAPKQKAEA